MTKDVRKAVGVPDNSKFNRRCVFYGIVLLAMLFAPLFLDKIMLPMAVSGITEAWYKIFVPITIFMMAIGLFRSWRRRWPLAYINNYNREAKENGYEICPRCGAQLVLKRRTRNHREKVGELVTTTTYTDGSKTVNREDVYGNVKRTTHFYQCTNNKCALEVDKHLSQSHLPWKNKQIRCLVLNDDRLLDHKHTSASHLLLSRLFVPFIAIIIIIVCCFTVRGYAKLHEGDWTFASADKEVSRTAEEYKTYLLSLDNSHRNWHMYYENKPSDMTSYLKEKFLGKDCGIGYGMECYNNENGTVLYYYFDGDDAGTGIPYGEYIIMQLDGINVLVDDDNEIIYKQGSEFYDTYASKLLSLAHDSILSAVLARVEGGEHALSDMDMEFIRKDTTTVYSYMLSDDITKISGGEFRAATLNPENNSIEQWFFSYDNSEYYPDDLDGYEYFDTNP